MTPRKTEQQAADDDAVLAYVTLHPAPDLSAYMVARALGWYYAPGCGYVKARAINGERARRALERLGKRGLLAFTDTPAGTPNGSVRTWAAPPVQGGPGQGT